MAKLKGRTALITGAGSGVGRACMTLFSQEGANVVGVGRTRTKLDETLAPILAAGGSGMVTVADVTDDAGPERAVAEAAARFGRVDILVHAAALGYNSEQEDPGTMGPIDVATPAQWRHMMASNIDAAFLTGRAIVRHMREHGGGSIVMIGSIGGFGGMFDSHAYGASKAALHNLVQSMAVTYLKDGIRTNAVAPGPIDTPMIALVIEAFRDPEKAKDFVPMARAASPLEIAQACLFFASNDSSYCNGSILTVDGGMTAVSTPNTRNA